MPQGPDGKTIIIVKKVSGHGGHHGGSWKVAYADFVTSMMCLFMVLWLVNSASVVTRERIASYFKKPGVFEVGSGAPIEMNGSGVLDDAFAPPSEANSSVDVSQDIYKQQIDEGLKKSGFPGGPQEKIGSGNGSKEQQRTSFEKTRESLEKMIKEDMKAISGLFGKIVVKLDQRGLHLEILDTENASMFERGSARIVPAAEEELKKIAATLTTLSNPMDIEGHTDAVPFSNATARAYDNWNLSTDRANAARRVLEAGGVKEGQISRVAGFAAQRPKVPADPLNPSNRRISISMRYTEQAAGALSGKKLTETKNGKTVTPPEIKPSEEQNVQTPQPESETSAAAANLESTETLKSESGLGLELKTTLPEGATVEPFVEPATREPWMEKDKIFSGENPFFRK